MLRRFQTVGSNFLPLGTPIVTRQSTGLQQFLQNARIEAKKNAVANNLTDDFDERVPVFETKSIRLWERIAHGFVSAA